MSMVTKVLLLIVVLTSFALQSAPVAAQTYIGEFCWIADDGEEDEGEANPTFIQLAIQLIGDSHFSVDGKAFEDASSGDATLLNGNGEILGNQIHFNLSGIHAEQEGVTEFLVSVDFLARVSLVDLNGTFKGIETVSNGSEVVESGAVGGTLAFASCP